MCVFMYVVFQPYIYYCTFNLFMYWDIVLFWLAIKVCLYVLAYTVCVHTCIFLLLYAIIDPFVCVTRWKSCIQLSLLDWMMWCWASMWATQMGRAMLRRATWMIPLYQRAQSHPLMQWACSTSETNAGMVCTYVGFQNIAFIGTTLSILPYMYIMPSLSQQRIVEDVSRWSWFVYVCVIIPTTCRPEVMRNM